MFRRTTLTRGLLLAALAATAVLSSVLPAAAGVFEVPDKTTGTVGAREFAGGECVYQAHKGPDVLSAIRVGAPKLYWPTKAGSGRRGKVGYRIELMDNGKLVRRSKLYSGTASRTASPAFVRRSMVVAPTPGHTYNVWITAVWYRPNGSKLGTVRHFVDYYKGSSGFMTWCNAEA